MGITEKELILIISGEDYELRKSEFKKLREQYKFISIVSLPDRHVWITEEHDQSVICNYFRDESGKTYKVTTNWCGKDVTPLLKNLIRLFITPVSNERR